MIARPCELKAGFLFSHPCKSTAAKVCSRCAKNACPEHSVLINDTPFCVNCARKAGDEDRSPLDLRTVGGSNPYFYRGYYSGYGAYSMHRWGVTGRDENDFTEADGMALGSEGSEAFEQDLDAS